MNFPSPALPTCSERGVYDARGERVEPGVPEALPPLPAGAPRNRLGLGPMADRPGAPANGAGRGEPVLADGLRPGARDDDRGLRQPRRSPPTHPELLDWLASRFIESGWDLKWLLKQMVLSGAYRRDSAPVGGGDRLDPKNQWLARGVRWRRSRPR